MKNFAGKSVGLNVGLPADKVKPAVTLAVAAEEEVVVVLVAAVAAPFVVVRLLHQL